MRFPGGVSLSFHPARPEAGRTAPAGPVPGGRRGRLASRAALPPGAATRVTEVRVSAESAVHGGGSRRRAGRPRHPPGLRRVRRDLAARGHRRQDHPGRSLPARPAPQGGGRAPPRVQSARRPAARYPDRHRAGRAAPGAGVRVHRRAAMSPGGSPPGSCRPSTRRWSSCGACSPGSGTCTPSRRCTATSSPPTSRSAAATGPGPCCWTWAWPAAPARPPSPPTRLMSAPRRTWRPSSCRACPRGRHRTCSPPALPSASSWAAGTPSTVPDRSPRRTT